MNILQNDLPSFNHSHRNDINAIVNVECANTPQIDAPAPTDKFGNSLLFDLPSGWKQRFEMRSIDTPAENGSNIVNIPSAYESQGSLSNKQRETSSPPCCSTQDDQSHISCRVDLGSTLFTHSIHTGDEPNTSADQPANDILESSFDLIDLDEDAIAALDAAIQRRQESQEAFDPSFRVLNLCHDITSSHPPTHPYGYPSFSSGTKTSNATDPIHHPLSSSCTTHQTPKNVTSHVTDATDDVYGDFPDIDFDALDQLVASRQHYINLQETQKPVVVTPIDTSKEPDCIRFTRYIICTTSVDNFSYQKILGVKLWSSVLDSPKDGRHDPIQCAATPPIQPDGYVYLQGEWYHAKCEAGDIIHICSISGRFDTSPSAFPIILKTQASASEDNDLVMVVHPDLLVTPTAISETIHCNRRAVLMTRLGSNGLSCMFCLVCHSNLSLISCTDIM